MGGADPGLNKPFDRILKAFAEEAPELFLRLLGIIPSDVNFNLAAGNRSARDSSRLRGQTRLGLRGIVHFPCRVSCEI
jgi:hypothetical protein